MSNCPSSATLSVAMATYNGENFLQHQLQSIASQSIAPYELVICDDGSSDQTISIIEEFKKQSSFPVRLFQNPSNLGSTLNFSKAIHLCQGDIVVLSDQDDVWMQNKLEKVLEAFELRPSAVGAFSNAELIDSAGRDLNKTLWGSLHLSKWERRWLMKGGLQAFKVLLRRNVITGATFAFRRKHFLDSAEVISSSWVHDAWIAINISRKGPIELIPDCLVGYRQHDANQIGVKYVPVRDRLYNSKALFSARYRMADLRQFLDGRDVEKEYLSLVDAKITHLEVRINEQGRFFPLIFEFISGGYRRYSAGVSSFGKDLVRLVLIN